MASLAFKMAGLLQLQLILLLTSLDVCCNAEKGKLKFRLFIISSNNKGYQLNSLFVKWFIFVLLSVEDVHAMLQES